MKQKKSFKSLKNCKAIGRGNVLPNLRGDTQKAKELFIIGPWIDKYFVDEIIKASPKSISVRILTRLANFEDDENIITFKTLKKLKNYASSFEARSLSTIHSKVIIIDNLIVYVGSTNWYKYSLENVPEITLRCSLSTINGLQRIAEEYWEEASEIDFNKNITVEVKNEDIDYEILDPLAREVLKNNPKAYIKRRK